MESISYEKWRKKRKIEEEEEIYIKKKILFDKIYK